MTGSFCPAPWNGLHIWQDGGVSPCCEIPPTQHQSLAAFMHSAEMQALRASLLAGDRPRACVNCWEKEDQGGRSSRLIELDIYGHDPSVLLPASRVNLYLSNKCNMACRMCSEDVSTGWIRDANDPIIERINGEVNGGVVHLGYRHGAHYMDELLDVVAGRDGPTNIRLRGGETLYIDENIQLLERLVSRGLDRRVRLGIITNGSIADGPMLDLLRGFAEVSIGVSIDGTEAVHGYIRGTSLPFKLIRDNATALWSLPSVTNRWVSMAVSPLNLLDLGDSARMIGETWPGVWIWHNRVVSPGMMDARIMPNTLKDLARDRLAGHAATLSDLAPCFAHDDDADHMRMRGLFATYTRRLDQLRGEDLARVVPELAPYLDSWNSAAGL